MVISGKGMTASLVLRTKIPNKKQRVRISITDITNQDFRKFLKEFNNSTYLGLKNKQVHNEPTEAYFLLINHISKLVKSKNHVRLHTKGVKSDVDETKCVNKTIRHINKTIQLRITLMNEYYL